MYDAFQHDAFMSGAFQEEAAAGTFAFQKCAFQFGAFQVDACTVPPQGFSNPGNPAGGGKWEREDERKLDAIIRKAYRTVTGEPEEAPEVSPQNEPAPEYAELPTVALPALVSDLAKVQVWLEAYQAELDDEEAILMLL